MSDVEARKKVERSTHSFVHYFESKVRRGICLNIYSLECTPIPQTHNVQDDFIVAILKSSIINGHVPQQSVINTPQQVADKCLVSEKFKSTFPNNSVYTY